MYSLDLLEDSGVKVRKRSEWGAQESPSVHNLSLPGRYLFMHITVTHQTGSFDRRTRVVERIGVRRFPNTRFPYTAVLHPGGEVHEGQPRGRKGAHTLNNKDVSGFPYDLNAYGHSLAFVGMPGDEFGKAEAEAAARYFAALVLSGESRATEILPHNKFAWKECPAKQVMEWLPWINRQFRKYVNDGHLPGREWSDLATKDEIKEALEEVLHDHRSGIESVDGSQWSLRYTIQRLWHRMVDLPRRVWRRRLPWWGGWDERWPDLAEKYEDGYSAEALQVHAYGHARAGREENRSNFAELRRELRELFQAQQPLLEAAAQGRAMSDEEVAEVAARVSEAVQEAVPEGLARDVADEFGVRLAPGENEGTAA